MHSYSVMQGLYMYRTLLLPTFFDCSYHSYFIIPPFEAARLNRKWVSFAETKPRTPVLYSLDSVEPLELLLFVVIGTAFPALRRLSLF